MKFSAVLLLVIVLTLPVFLDTISIQGGSILPDEVERSEISHSIGKEKAVLVAGLSSFSVKVLALERPTVGLQVGHWKLEDGVPEELKNLDPDRQAKGGGKVEWQVNLDIAQRVRALLEKEGIEVDLLSAVPPVGYLADAFVSIHADQNPSAPWFSGYKVGVSAFDQSGLAKELASYVTQEYGKSTLLKQETYIPRSMTQYYAFNSQKFVHAISPMTPAILIETGYLPNPLDWEILLKRPDLAAQGIATGILQFLNI